jgi:ATP-dependent DNA helicase RecG
MAEIDHRHFMELAIEVMRKSIAESRADGKASPCVGAVLVEPGARKHPHGRFVTAFRGELRDGDHAEYTLLERKSRDKSLAHCVLFATLEPCAPNSRKHPKLGCAERIVLARIKEVWIGIPDPDPTVDRKGIKFLQDNGVIVRMFDQDLQEVIRLENKDFIKQALERAAAVEDVPKDVVLSSLERPQEHANLNELSTPALERYRKAAEIPDAPDSAAFQRRLARQGLLVHDGQQWTPTGFGMLLFGDDPRTAMPQAGLLATIHYPDGNEETHDFDGPLVDIPEEVMQWLQNKLPNVLDRSEARRRSRSAPFFELVREGVVNALVHRDYDQAGAKCQLQVYPDKIVIMSPGPPVAPITIAQMQSFDAPMLSRNPVLHFVLAELELAEERGLGLKSMRLKAESAGLPLPRYEWKAPYLSLTLFPNVESSAAMLTPDVRAELSEPELACWQWISTKSSAKSSDYAKAARIDGRTARRHLQRLVDLKLVRIVGAGPSTRYEVASTS